MRLFYAIRLSPEICASIAAYQRALRMQGVRAGFACAENLHLTLAFLGEQPNADAASCALDRLRFAPFALTLENTGCFGDVLWVGLRENPQLALRSVISGGDVSGCHLLCNLGVVTAQNLDEALALAAKRGDAGITSLLLTYQKDQKLDADPMAEFTLDW